MMFGGGFMSQDSTNGKNRKKGSRLNFFVYSQTLQFEDQHSLFEADSWFPKYNIYEI